MRSKLGNGVAFLMRAVRQDAQFLHYKIFLLQSHLIFMVLARPHIRDLGKVALSVVLSQGLLGVRVPNLDQKAHFNKEIIENAFNSLIP
jgi:hypothetical protein